MEHLVQAVSKTFSDDKKSKDAINYTAKVVGWILIAIGFLYILMQLLCLRKLCDVDEEDMKVTLVRGHDGEEGGDGGYTRQQNNTAPSTASARAENELIVNLATALGMSPSEARKRFGGSSGASAARKLRAEREETLTKAAAAAASMANKNSKQTFDQADSAYVPPSTQPAHGSAASFTPAEAHGGGYDSDEDLRAKRIRQQEAEAEASYLASQGSKN